MKYFKPSDIRALRSVVQHVGENGFAFAASEQDELIFIPNKIVESCRLDIGDEIMVYAVPSSHSDPTKSREEIATLRAVRVIVEKRLSEHIKIEGRTTTERTAPPPPTPEVKRAELTNEIIKQFVIDMLQEPRAWSVAQMKTEITRLCGVEYEIKSDLNNPIWTALASLHAKREATACRIFSSGDQVSPSAVYWARSKEIFLALIEDTEVS